MPLYEFICPKKHKFDQIVTKYDEDGTMTEKCPTCGKLALHNVTVTGTSFRFNYMGPNED